MLVPTFFMIHMRKRTMTLNFDFSYWLLATNPLIAKSSTNLITLHPPNLLIG